MVGLRCGNWVLGCLGILKFCVRCDCADLARYLVFNNIDDDNDAGNVQIMVALRDVIHRLHGQFVR